MIFPVGQGGCMLHSQRFGRGSQVTGVVNHASGAHAHIRRLLVGIVFTSLVLLAGMSVALAQEEEKPERVGRQERQERQERVADWASDSLDWVAASPEQIRDVLAKNPGLMVELKRLVAKQAIDKGQIVGEQDLADDVIMDRLATDTRFRGTATLLLQRYGYLTPQIN